MGQVKFLIVSLFLFINFIFAQDANRVSATSTPIKKVTELLTSSRDEQMKQLSEAKILIADYDLIKKDFPELRRLTNDQIDNWILKHTSYVSIPQTSQTSVNTQIPVTDKTTKVHRPARYGRAIVFDVFDPGAPDNQIGIIDVKGTGSLTPSQRDHGNGLATLGECIREFIYERMIREVLTDADLPNKTVGSYAVIDPGFDVKHADGSTSPAGFYLRQGHAREAHEWMPQPTRNQIERIFHKYGIDPDTNIQATNKKDIFDFGHFVVKDSTPGLDPRKKLPMEIWGYDKSIPNPGHRWFYSKEDYPWRWSHELADSWRKGMADRDAVWKHYKNLIDPAIRAIVHGNSDPGSCQSAATQLGAALD